VVPTYSAGLPAIPELSIHPTAASWSAMIAIGLTIVAVSAVNALAARQKPK
jgi:hypothetical protein